MTHRIVSGLRAGEPGAVSELFGAVGEELFQYCWLMVRSRDTAFAVVRDTMIAAHARIDRLRNPGQLRPWLYALARMECERYTPAASEGAVLLLNASGDETRLMAWRAVMSLPPAEREILDLTARLGMSAADAGLVTGLGDGATSLIEQARANLQQAMVAEIAARRPGLVSGRVSPRKVYARLPWPASPPGMRADILACFPEPPEPVSPVRVSPSGVSTVSPSGVSRGRRLAAGLLAAAVATGAALVLAIAGLSLPLGTWSIAPAGSATSAPAGAIGAGVARTGPGGTGTQPMVAPTAGVTGRARTRLGPRQHPGPGPGPGRGNTAALYLAAARPRSQPSPQWTASGRGVSRGSQPSGSQPGPAPDTALVLPPPPVSSPVPSSPVPSPSGRRSCSGSASPSPSVPSPSVPSLSVPPPVRSSPPVPPSGSPMPSSANKST
jgi:DNA-directed RNA polymerase specialized sigma24 family protein